MSSDLSRKDKASEKKPKDAKPGNRFKQAMVWTIAIGLALLVSIYFNVFGSRALMEKACQKICDKSHRNAKLVRIDERNPRSVDRGPWQCECQ